MTERNTSDKSGSPEDDDFDFASFLEDSGEKKGASPPPEGVKPPPKDVKAGAGDEDDDFASLLEGEDDPTVKDGPPPSDTHELGDVNPDELATFLGEVPTAKDQVTAKTSDDDDFASFLADEEKKGEPLPARAEGAEGTQGAELAGEMEGDDFDEFLKSNEGDEGPLTESELDLLSEAPTKTLESFSAARKADETSELDAGATGEVFALADDDEETEVVMEQVTEAPVARSASRSRLATVGTLAAGLLLGGAGAYGGLSFLQMGPLKQELEEVKAQSVANRKKADFLQQQRDGAFDQETQAKTALEASVKDLGRAKAVAAKAVKQMQAAEKAQKAAQGAAAELQKSRDLIADLKQQLDAAKAAATVPAAAAPPAGEAGTETLAKLEATTKELEAARAQVEELTAEVKELSLAASAAEKPAPAEPTGGELAAAQERIEELSARIKELESAPAAPTPAAPAEEAPRAVAKGEAEAKTEDTPEVAPDEEKARLNQQLADARAELQAATQELAKAREAGAGSTSLYVGPKSNSEVAVSLQSYHDGLHDFFLGDYDAALEAFGAAIEQNPRDARYYYFRALVHRRRGNSEKAAQDAKEGWTLERQELPTTYEVSQALERIQGSDRFWLQSQRAQKPGS